jgi:hypothetical protein
VEHVSGYKKNPRKYNPVSFHASNAIIIVKNSRAKKNNVVFQEFVLYFSSPILKLMP